MRFKLLGTEIYISFLFAAVIVLMLSFDRTGLVVPTALAVMIHEFGHLLAMWAAGCAPKSIRLIPASVQIIRSFSVSSGAEIAILLSGPTANVSVFLALYLNTRFFGNENIYAFGVLNLIIALFNLLPVHPLDGSRILAYFLPAHCNRWIEEHSEMISLVMMAVIFLTDLVSVPLSWLAGHVFDLLLLMTEFIDPFARMIAGG